MRSCPLPLLLGLAGLFGCLKEGPSPTGQHLYHSQTLEAPGFVDVGADEYVHFNERLAAADGTKGGVYDLWISSFSGDVLRKVVSNWSDHWGGPSWGVVDGWGGHYFWANEREVASGGGSAVVGSWIRLGATFAEEHRIEGASTATSFTAPLSWIYDDPTGRACPGFPSRRDGCPQALFERPAPAGQTSPTLYLWDGLDEIPIGADVGGFQLQITGSGSIYCILGDKRTFSRLLRPGNQLQALRDNVSSFSVRGDERYVSLGVTDQNKAKTVIRDMLTGDETTLARPNASPLVGFSGNTFSYWQGATSSAPAEYHTLDLDTGVDTFDTLPAPLTNQVATIGRPGTDEILRIDSLGHGVFTGVSDYVARRVIQGPLIQPSFPNPEAFKDDPGNGKYLIHLQRATSTSYDPDIQGALMFEDADQIQSDTMVSPAGLLLAARNGAPYFFTDHVLAFWAHLGRASSDLYFADYTPGSLPTNLRMVAQSIMSVSVSEHNLFGILNVSQQDGVGDLVYRDLDHGTDVRYAQAVSDAAQWAPIGANELWQSWTAYIVRGRADSDHSGIWLTRLAPVPGDGGTD